MAKIKKAQKGDSTAYYKRQGDLAAIEMSRATTPVATSIASNKIAAADKNAKRQKLKGKAGYDKMGFPVKKQKMGGKTSCAKCGKTIKKK